jgi:hypothetical protein
VADLVVAIELYAGWLYILLGVLVTIQVATMWRAGQERELALFSLERDAAAGKAVRAFVTLLLLVTIGAGVYTVETVLAPSLPPSPDHVGAAEPPMLTDPVLSTAPTEAPTASPTTRATERPVIVTSTPELTPAPAPLP